MKELELATKTVRVFPSTYKKIMDEAKKRRTVAAMIIDERLK